MNVAVLCSLVICSQLGHVRTQKFECPDKDGLFPHPQQCDRYFQCQNGEANRMLCPDGLVFDPDKVGTTEDACDHIQNTKHKCEGKPDLQRPKPGDGFCPRQNGVYPSPDPTECDKFYSCLNGVGSVTQCANGLHFDPEIGTCVWARESSRKGCLSVSERDQQKVQATPQVSTEGPAEALSNGFTCPGGKLGIHISLPHPNSCHLYYVCQNGVTPSEAGCGNNLVFNPQTARCDDPENVPGCENTFKKNKPKRQSALPRSQGRQRSESSREEQESGLDVAQFAKFIEILTNPKVKSILKPEVADALSSFQRDTEEDDVATARPQRRRKRPRRPFINPPSTRLDGEARGNDQINDREEDDRFANTGSQSGNDSDDNDNDDDINSDEVEPVDSGNSKDTRRIPFNRKNKFTSRFIPRVRPTQRENEIQERKEDQDQEREDKEEAEEAIPDNQEEREKEKAEDNDDQQSESDVDDNRTSLPGKRFSLRRPFGAGRRPGFPFRRRNQDGTLRGRNSQSKEERDDEANDEKQDQEQPENTDESQRGSGTLPEKEDDMKKIAAMGEQLLRSLARPRSRPARVRNQRPQVEQIAELLNEEEHGEFQEDFGDFLEEFKKKKKEENNFRNRFQRPRSRDPNQALSSTFNGLNFKHNQQYRNNANSRNLPLVIPTPRHVFKDSPHSKPFQPFPSQLASKPDQAPNLVHPSP
eukprot:TCALIF_00276-PA protein Name:"Similar to Endochitinase (Brugia malayi)" AED:0.30 eAED:0.30 QI:0/0/0/0.5/1/1/2/0/700